MVSKGKPLVDFTFSVYFKTRLQNLDYNVPYGKLNRGMAVVDTVEILKGRSLSNEEYFKAALLGWCVELVRFCIIRFARIIR